MKIYVTRYWERRGVLKMEGEPEQTRQNAVKTVTGNRVKWYHKPDWHTTPEEAITDVMYRQIKTIAALKTRIRKIQAIKL